MKRPQQDPLSAYVFGSAPPSHPDLEEVVIGSILIDKGAMQTCVDVFGDGNPFYLSSIQDLYRVALKMHYDSRPIDLMTLSAELQKAALLDSIGGPYRLIEYTNRVGSTANLEWHCRIIQQDYIQREIIRAGSDLIRLAYDQTTDALDLMDLAEKALTQFTRALVQPVHQGVDRIAQEMMTQAENIRLGKATPGIPSGLVAIDNVLRGFVPGALYVFAGTPGMGKTAFIISMMRRMAAAGTKCGLFSLEMSSLQIVQRMTSQVSKVGLSEIQNPKGITPLKFQVLTDAAGEVSNLPILIDETSGLSINQLRGKARAMYRDGVRCIFVDYLQLMSGSGKEGNREQEVAAITRGLVGIAKELNIPVIALSQLSREVAKRPNRRPQLSDLRESGSIEQDAYAVGFVFRPEYYEVYKDPDTGEDLRGVALVIIAKHRNGAIDLDGVKLRFDGSCTEFRDFSGVEPGPLPSQDLGQYAPDLDRDLPF